MSMMVVCLNMWPWYCLISVGTVLWSPCKIAEEYKLNINWRSASEYDYQRKVQLKFRTSLQSLSDERGPVPTVYSPSEKFSADEKQCS